MKKLGVLVIAAVLALGACWSDADDGGSDGDNPVIETPSTVAP